MNTFWVARRRYLKRARLALRRHVPQRYWAVARTVGRTCLRAVESFFTTVVALVLKVLPDGVSVALRERLALVRPLDYEQAVIALRVTSRIEREVRLRSCEKEPETIEWIHRSLKPGDVLYDIGANVGAYSLVAARWTRLQATVYAFEPGYATFPSLVENIFLNETEDAITPFPVAIGARTGLTGFQYGTLEPGGATHGGINATATSASSVRTQMLATYRLDDFVELMRLRSPTHLKIDVDGSELDVLLGGAATLRSPGLEWVLVEVTAPGPEAASIKELLEQCGFGLVSDHEHAGGMTHNWIFRRKPLSADRTDSDRR